MEAQYNSQVMNNQKSLSESFIPSIKMERSLDNYNRNTFVQFLFKSFGKEITVRLIKQYFIGTPDDDYFSTVFWQIDLFGNIRTGKSIRYEILYNEETFSGINCKMNKDTFPYFEWILTPYKRNGFSLKQCFFGEHLLYDTTKPIAIVEGEKTAVIASIYLPQYIWLANGGTDYLTVNKCSVLHGRTVVLFPRISNYDDWNEKKKELSRSMPGISFNISESLKKEATYEMREDDYDIADYLIRFDWRTF